MSGVVYEIDDEGEAKALGPATAEHEAQLLAEKPGITTDDPLAGLEDLRQPGRDQGPRAPGGRRTRPQ